MFSHCFTYTIVQVDEPLQFDFIYFQNSTNSVNFCISILFSSFLQQKETIGKPASNGLQVRNGCIPTFLPYTKITSNRVFLVQTHLSVSVSLIVSYCNNPCPIDGV